MKSLSVVLFCALVISACSKVDEFKKDTSKVIKTTSEMKATADNLNEVTLSLFPQMRSSNAISVRNEEFDILTDRNNKLGEKMVAAGVFFMSLEFQFWTANNTHDNEVVLDRMFRDAADEFQGRMYDLYREINPRKMTPMKEGYWHNEESAFYALAMTMDRSHYYQEELKKKHPELKFVSFYEVIQEALRKEHHGLLLSRHEEILLSGINKEIITELIRARVDIMSALALRDMMETRKMTSSQTTKGIAYYFTEGRLGELAYDQSFQEINSSSKKNIEMYLDKALATKEFLAKIGINHRIEKNVRVMISGIDLGDRNLKSMDNDSQIKAKVERLLAQ